MNSRIQVNLTVALLTYNRSAWLRETVEAILAQTYRDFEFLILDNGSTDETPQYLINLTDPRIRYVRNSPGSSIEFNSVSAYLIARGKRVIVTHDDDIMEPEMLERQMEFLDKNPNAKLVWTHIRTIDHRGLFISPSAEILPDKTFAPGEYIANFLTERRWPMPSGVMLERSLIAQRLANLNYYCTTKIKIRASNIEVAGIEDVRIPAKINTRHAIGFIGTQLLRYRVHSGQGTHAVDLSKPSIYLYRLLRRMARQIPGHPIPEISFKAHILKHQTQYDITHVETPEVPKRIKQRISRYWHDLTTDPTLTHDALYTALPIAISTFYFGLIPAKLPQLEALPLPEHHTTATRYFYLWATRLSPGFSIFSGFLARQRIVIFGSALVSSLLILDARQNGQEIIACIDSNIHRQKYHLLGTPIFAPEWLTEHSDSVDIVIFSSEKDQEFYLAKRVQELTKTSLRMLSWKEMLLSENRS